MSFINIRFAFFKPFGLTLLILHTSCMNEEIFFDESIDFTQGSYSLIVVPDTQYYSSNDSQYEILFSAFNWIKKNKEKYNIKGILQTGDLTQQNSIKQWARIKKAFDIIENDIPYSICLGNHDYEGNGNPENRETNLNYYFNHQNSMYNDGIAVSEYGYLEEKSLENYFIVLNTIPKKTLIVSLEWFPRDNVIIWADSIIQKFQHMDCIVLTHAFLTPENSLFDFTISSNGNSKINTEYGPEGQNNNAKQLWEKLITMNNNIFLVLNGHVMGNAFLQLHNNYSERVNLMAFNTQHEPNGGNGWIRLLEFLPDNTKVKVHTFSPSLKKLRYDLGNHFVFSK